MAITLTGAPNGTGSAAAGGGRPVRAPGVAPGKTLRTTLISDMSFRWCTRRATESACSGVPTGAGLASTMSAPASMTRKRVPESLGSSFPVTITIGVG